MSLESQVQNLVTQTQQLDKTVSGELIDVNNDILKIRERVTALEIKIGLPDDDQPNEIPGGGGTSPSNPNTNLGNGVIQIDTDNDLIWLWNPDSNSWVSIPFTEIAPPLALDVQAIIDQANNAIDDGLQDRIDALAASITETVLTTQQSQIDGLAAQVTTIGTAVDDNVAAIQAEATARATADTALASQVTDLVAEVDANHQAFISFQAAVVADPDGAAAEYLQALQSQVATNTAAIQTEASTRAAADTATANQVNTLVTAVNGAQAAIQQEITARSSADSALTTSVTNLASRVGTAEGAIQTLQTVTSGLDANTVSNITTLTSTVGNLTTTVQDTATAVNGVTGKRTLAIDANGKVTGIELLGGGLVGSQIKFQANSFIFYDPSTGLESVPFAISGGTVYINKAVIKNADIDTLKLANNAATATSSATIVNAKATQVVTLLTISGLGASETVPVHISAGVVANTGCNMYTFCNGEQLSVDYTKPANCSYIGSTKMLGNGTHTITVSIDLPSTDTTMRRLSVIAQAMKR